MSKKSKFFEMNHKIVVDLSKVVEFSAAMTGDECVFIRFIGDKHSERYNFPFSEFKKAIKEYEKANAK